MASAFWFASLRSCLAFASAPESERRPRKSRRPKPPPNAASAMITNTNRAPSMRSPQLELGGEDRLDGAIVGRGRQAIEELKPERQPHCRSGFGHARQESVEIAEAMAEPVPAPVERHAGHQDQIHIAHRHRAPRGWQRLPHPVRATTHLRGWVADLR